METIARDASIDEKVAFLSRPATTCASRASTWTAARSRSSSRAAPRRATAAANDAAMEARCTAIAGALTR